MKLPTRLKALLSDKRKEIILVAHRRWAKTLHNCAKCILAAVENVDHNYYIILPTYKQAKRVAWKILKKVARDTEMPFKINETELKITFDNESFVQLLGGDRPDDIRGIAANGVCLDEWSLHKPTLYTEIIVPALMDRNGWCVKSYTPKGQNHAYEDFISAVDPYFFSADTSGVFTPEQLERARKTQSEDEFDQEMLCKFLTYSGLVYNNFSDSVNICEPFDIPDSWVKLVGIDYGLTNPTAIPLMAVDYDGCVYIYNDDIYDSDMSVEESAGLLKAKMEEQEYVAYIDPSTLAKDQTKKLPDGTQIRYSIYKEFQKNGLQPLYPAINSVLPGINKVKTLIGQGKLKIFRTCTNVLLELRNYRWKLNKNKGEMNNAEAPVKVNDHLLDAIRYAIATNFQAPVEAKKPAEKMTLEWFELEEEQARKRQKKGAFV